MRLANNYPNGTSSPLNSCSNPSPNLSRALSMVGYFTCMSAVLVTSAYADGDHHTEHKDIPAPKASEIRERVDRMKQVELDLSSLHQEKSLEGRKLRAKEILRDLIEKGDPVLTTHAVVYLANVPDKALESVLRSRLAGVGSSWSENHLEMGLRNYLALLGDQECLEKIISYTTASQISFRIRAYRALRDIEPSSLGDEGSQKVREGLRAAIETEKDPAGQSALLASIACWEEEAIAQQHLEDLNKLASSDEHRQQLRASLEIRQLKRWASSEKSGSEPPSDQNAEGGLSRDDLFDLLKTGGHDEQMFAVEALSHDNDPNTRGKMLDLCQSKAWPTRLQGAFYLLLTRDMPEVDRLLREENQPFVQLALLCALAIDAPVAKGAETAPQNIKGK